MEALISLRALIQEILSRPEERVGGFVPLVSKIRK
jgi:hypothetical protein